MHKFRLILAVRRDSFNRQQRRSIRLEFHAPRSPEHDGAHFTMFMTPQQVEAWEKDHGKPLIVGTVFSNALEIESTTTGENNEYQSNAGTQEVDKR